MEGNLFYFSPPQAINPGPKRRQELARRPQACLEFPATQARRRRPGRGGGRSGPAPPARRSDGPGFLAVAHVPEHPLVAARVAEVAVYQVSFGRAETGTHLVGHADHGPHHVAELVAPVRADPALVARVRRAAAQ